MKRQIFGDASGKTSAPILTVCLKWLHKRLQEVAKGVSCQVKPPTNLFKLPNYVDDLCIDILVSVTIITT